MVLTNVRQTAALSALVFTGPKGAPLRRGNFTRAWRQATASSGLVNIHFHDLRHTGNTLAVLRGWGQPARTHGPDGPQQHAGGAHLSALRDKMIAAAISERVSAELTSDRPSGT